VATDIINNYVKYALPIIHYAITITTMRMYENIMKPYNQVENTSIKHSTR